MIDYDVVRIRGGQAISYMKQYHYSHGCHNGPSPCYGLFDNGELIGVCAFATPCSERVRSSIFGEEHKEHVTELHRLHIQDCTPKNTESWFIARCLKLLKADKPDIWAVISFSDLTAGHTGVIYRASNAYFLGATRKMRFYYDTNGRLRHPRQCGVNIKEQEAAQMGWKPVMRESKYRYLFLLPSSRRNRKELMRITKYNLFGGIIMKHRTCADCGANLDPGERCDCKDENNSSGAEVESYRAERDFYRRRVSVRGTVQKQPQLLATGGRAQ